MIIKQVGAGVLLMLLLAGCTVKSEYRLLQTKNTAASEALLSDPIFEYRILPQDRLKVSLYKNPEQASAGTFNELGQPMNNEGILVNAEGCITLPLVNEIKVSGLTQTQAADRITQHYKTYLKNPSVYLEVINKRVYVLGEVKKPGAVNVDKEKMTLLEAIAFAEDMTDSAMRSNVVVVSHNSQNQMVMRQVDLTNFDTLHAANLMVKPNDIIYVQPNNWKQFKVVATDTTSLFETVSRIASPFVTIKYLTD
jgi:polysaccharide export outer membrane protein